MAPVEEAAKPGYILAVMHQGKKTFTVLGIFQFLFF